MACEICTICMGGVLYLDSEGVSTASTICGDDNDELDSIRIPITTFSSLTHFFDFKNTVLRFAGPGAWKISFF